MPLEKLLADFAGIEDWETRYAYLIDLGKTLEKFPEDQRIEVNKVQGCTSQVWLVGSLQPNNTMQYSADSDSVLVKGLLAVQLAAYNHKSPTFIQEYDMALVFETLGLAIHLTSNRRNGFSSVNKRIRILASAFI